MVKAAMSSTDDRITAFLDSFRNLQEKFSTSLMIQAVVEGNNRGETVNRIAVGMGVTIFCPPIPQRLIYSSFGRRIDNSQGFR
jgi:deoxyhypusine synthase